MNIRKEERYRTCFCGITLTIWELWKNILWNDEENEDECIQRMIIAKNENEGKILFIMWMEKKSAETVNRSTKDSSYLKKKKCSRIQM